MYCDWPVLGRCCFCVPLRRGVIAFGYVSILFNAFMAGLYSYTVHHDLDMEVIPINRLLMFPAELCIVFCCLEIIFNGILVYGAHMKLVNYIRAYYYFSLATSLAITILQIVDLTRFKRFHMGIVLELLTLTFAGLCMQIYIITIVRSLLKKLEVRSQGYENQLHQIVSGEVKIETNGIYNNTTAPAEI